MALYNAAGGAGWINRSGWLGAGPLGSWHGVTTDAAGRVTRLNLNNNGLSGSLPSALGSLTGLRSLFLYGNAGLTGALPVSLLALVDLQNFYAFGTGLCLPAALEAWHAAIGHKGAISACTGGEVPTALSFGTATVSAQSYVVRSAITALTLPAARGGAQPVSYSLTPALPVGLGFDRSTRVLSGIPLVVAPARAYTYTATDADGDTASLTFTITVGSEPSAMLTDREALVALYNAAGGATWTSNANWLSDRPLSEWHGVTTDSAGRVTGLNLNNNALSGSLPPELGNLTRLRSLLLHNNPDLSGPLPVEMGQIQNLDTFHGFGTGLTLPSSLTGWYATIATSSTLPAHQEDAISFGTQTIPGRCYTEAVPRSEIVLPAATGGSGAVTYTLTPALPPGLSFDPANRSLSGTLGRQGWTVSSQSYFYTARDGAGDTATLSFTITLVEGSEDRQTLVAFFHATGGLNWGGGSNWLSHCAPISQWRGVSANLDRHVTGLSLSSVGLTGMIPPELSDLEDLETLDLSFNRLTGAIPAELGALSHLKELDLRGNKLTGGIPGALGNLASLETLDLSDNRLTGPLPAALGGLKNLQSLTLSGNLLAGALPSSLGALVRLSYLNVRSTGFSGDLPASLKNLRLGTFYTAGSRLCLPEDMVEWYLTIGDHDYLDFKEVAGGYVEYSPKESCGEELSFKEQTIGDLSYEARTDMSGSPITSLTLPEATGGVGELSYSLTPALPIGLTFNPQTRILSGTPTRVQAATVYTYTARDTNDKVATLTFSITVTERQTPLPTSDRAVLVTLYNATGGGTSWSASNWLSNLPLDRWGGVRTDDGGRVISLDLRGSGFGVLSGSLTGSIPPELGNLTNLERLNVSGNELTGMVPQSFLNLRKLRSLNFSTQFSDFPYRLCISEELNSTLSLTVEIYGTDICDHRNQWRPLPGSDGAILVALYNATGGGTNWTNWFSDRPLDEWLGVKADASGRVIEINLSSDTISGTLNGHIPPELGSLSNLKVLDLSGAHFVPFGIPPELGNLQNLEILNLSASGLSGTIPRELGNLANLKTLNLSNNNLNGSVPSELGNLSRLEVLDITLNSLRGVVPQSLANLMQLQRFAFEGQGFSEVGQPHVLCISKSLYRTLSRTAIVTGTFFCEDLDQQQASDSAAAQESEARRQAYRAAREAIATTLDASAAALLSSAAAYVDRQLDSGGDMSVVVGGQALPLSRRSPVSGDTEAPIADWRDGEAREEWTMDWDALLQSSSFELAFGADESKDGALWTLSGHSTVSSFGNQHRDIVRAGTLRTGWLGMDARLGAHWRAGVAGSQSEFVATYLPKSSKSPRHMRMTLTGMYPWLRLMPNDRSVIWAMAGAAEGDFREGPDDEAERGLGAVSAHLALTGGRWSFFPEGPFDIALTSDAGFARVETAGAPAVTDSLAGEAWRSRFGVEASWTVSLGDELETTPFFEIDGRRDGGRKDRRGIEAAGGIRVAEQSLGLDLEARGRVLKLRPADETGEWGASLTARLSPQGDGTGLALSFSPRWGASTEEVGALWRDDVFSLARGGIPEAESKVSLDARAEYGVAVPSGTLTPFGEFGMRDYSERELRLGIQLTTNGKGGRGVSLGIAGNRRERSGRESEHRISLIGNLRF